METRGGFRFWRYPVPYVPPAILESAVFIYPTEAEARAGERWGGSGFLIGVPCVEPVLNQHLVHLYAVTNDHVSRGCPWVRVNPWVHWNQTNADPAFVNGAGQWVPHPDGDDVAVFYLGLVSQRAYRYFGIRKFIYPSMVARYGIGPGDNCLMVGRFIQPATKRQLDRPVLRFGNLAMLPEKIRQTRRAFDQLSFLVDMRSIGGFSGSAVVVYMGAFDERVKFPDIDDSLDVTVTFPVGTPHSDVMGQHWLLGVDWGHLPVSLDAFDQDTDVTEIDPASIGQVVANSGMSCVVPAWKITELLGLPIGETDRIAETEEVQKIVQGREEAEAESAKEKEGAVMDEAAPSDGLTEGDFRSVLHKATRIIPDESAQEG